MYFQNQKEKILIVDFGSQVTKLIARRVRDLGVFSEIVTPKETYKIKDFKYVKGIILSGGPSTVTQRNYQRVPKQIFKKEYSNSWDLLWTTINCKTIWWKNKVI